MSSGRRRKGGHGGEFHLDERWMTSYADMITVLMCLFIVLYAMSTVDSHKFDVLKNSLASGFGVTNSAKLDLTKGIPVPKQLIDKNGIGFTASNTTTGSLKLEKTMKAAIDAALQKANASKLADVKVDARGITIGLVGSSAYFDGNDASLRPAAVTVLRAVAPIIGQGVQTVTVEGHADPHGSPGRFGNDWNLAAARAGNVLLYLVDHGVAGTRISSVSYGSAQPVAGEGKATIEKNRRVDIVVHTAAAASTASPAAPAATPTPTASAGH
ncbi:MAG TPA: flagellar motor protein MotB [Amnibacterium sp.]|nr:flagellar motor protein MotB [Amnibacterium sp.]